jgi:ribosomal protein S18 acetylase RimI-like enzyme
MTKAVRDADADILIANQEDGFVHVAEATPPNLRIFRPDRWLSVENLYVVPEQRRRGIGRGLMGAAYAWGTARALTKVRLGVWHNNHVAKAFYRSLGYRELRVVLEVELGTPDPDVSGRAPGH